MNTKPKWEVHGWEYGNEFHVCRPVSENRSALEYLMNGKQVKFFSTIEKATLAASKLNKQDERVAQLLWNPKSTHTT